MRYVIWRCILRRWIFGEPEVSYTVYSDDEEDDEDICLSAEGDTI